MIKGDDEAWLSCHHEDLWIFDKCILSRKLGYTCGPVDVDVPESNFYIVRPCVNLAGMSRGASIEYIENTSGHLPAGYFWCEMFEGRHLSVDYYYGNQKLITEGFRRKDRPLWKFDKWVRVDDEIEYPDILNELKGNYPSINCEFIGDKLIEIHLRSNEEMGKYKEIIPVWKDEDLNHNEYFSNGYEYFEHKDYKRLGFYKR